MKTIKLILNVALLVGVSVGFYSCGDDDADLQASAKERFLGKWESQTREFFECSDQADNRTETCPGESFCLKYEFFEDGTIIVYNTADTQVDQGTYIVTSISVILDLDRTFGGGPYEFIDSNSFTFLSVDADCKIKITFTRSN
jgi:hypothetical protein